MQRYHNMSEQRATVASNVQTFVGESSGCGACEQREPCPPTSLLGTVYHTDLSCSSFAASCSKVALMSCKLIGQYSPSAQN